MGLDADNLARVRELLAERNWEIVEGEQADGLGADRLWRRIRALHRELFDECLQYLPVYTSAGNNAASATVENPMLGTRWHREGVWTGGRVWHDWVPDQKSGERELCIFQELYKGSDSDAGIVTRRDCAYRVTGTYYYGQATIVTLPAAASGVFYRMTDPVRNPQRGTYTYSVEKWERLYQVEAQHVSEVSPARVVRSRIHKGVRDGDLKDNGDAVSLQSMVGAQTGKVLRQSRNKNDDCTRDIQEEEITPADQTGTEFEASPARVVTRATHTEGPALAAPTAEVGKVKRRSSRPTEAGNAATVDETTTPADQTGAEFEVSPAVVVTRTTHTEGTALVAPTPETGKIKRRVNRPTEAGNAATVDEEEVPADQTGSEREESAGRSVARTTHTEGTALVAPVQETGKIKRHVNQPTRAGNVATVAEEVTPKDQTGTEFEASAARTVERATHTEGTALVAPTPETGKIKRRVSRPTEAGNAATVDETTTPADQTGAEFEVSPAVVVTRTTHTEGTALVAPTPETGKIKRRVNRPTEAGNAATVDEEEVPADQTGSEREESAGRSVARTTHTEGTALGAPVAETGKIKRHVNQPTRAGNAATVEETVTPKDQTGAEFEASAAGVTTRTTHTEGTALAAPVAETGKIKRRANRPTEAGNAATVDEETVPANQERTSYSARADRAVVVQEATETTPGAAPTAGDGQAVNVDNQPASSGSGNTRRVTTTATAQKLGASLTYLSADGTKALYAGDNLTWAEVQAILLGLNGYYQNDVSLDISKEFVGRYSLSVHSRSVGTGITTTDWEGFGEYFQTVYTPRSKQVNYCVYRTTVESRAQEYARGTLGNNDAHPHGNTTSGCTIIGGYGNYQTGIYYRGNGRWLAVRVEAVSSEMPWYE